MRGTVSNTKPEKKSARFVFLLEQRVNGTNFFLVQPFFFSGIGPFAERDLLGACLRHQQEELRGHV